MRGNPKSCRKDRTDFNKNLEVNYSHHYEEEKNLIIKWNEKIKRKLEIKRRRKWIKFKNKRLTTRCNLNKESNNRVTSNIEVETAYVDIVLRNEDQQGNFPTGEQLKFITDNLHQRRKNRMYADAVVNIPEDPVVSSRTKELSKSKMDNKTVVTSEELRGIYDMLISDEPNAVDSCPPFLTTKTSISENTSTSYRTDGSRQEVVSQNNSVSRLDEELISVLVDLQSDDFKQDFAIVNSVVRSEGLATKATITDEDVLQVHFVLNMFSTVVKEHYRVLRFRLWRRGWTFHQFRDPLMNQSFERILKSLLEKCVLNGTFQMNPQAIFHYFRLLLLLLIYLKLTIKKIYKQ